MFHIAFIMKHRAVQRQGCGRHFPKETPAACRRGYAGQVAWMRRTTQVFTTWARHM